MSKSTIVRGAFLLTGASFLSKFLGMIYVIPFNAMVGPEGVALYAYAYLPYSILITIATIGIPLAVSKFISKYNSLGDYYTGMRMFKTGMSLMAITGIITFLALFFSAELIANLIISDEELYNNVEDVTMVIRMVSFALIITPSMSIMRGFFQGNQSMGPTAVSQVIEQIARIVFLLVAAFLIIYIFNGTTTTAVGYATFAAFIGAIFSYVVLLIYWKKRKPFIDKKLAEQKSVHDIPKKELMTELFRYAGPFVIVSLAIPLFQIVDTFTFNRTMVAIGQGGIAEALFGSIYSLSHKLVIIPVTIATGLSLAVMPVVTSSFTQGEKPLLNNQINQALQIILVLVIPASFGLTMLSSEAYGTLFGGLETLSLTGPLLGWYAPVGILFALLTVTASILQGINQQNHAVFNLCAGFLFKVLFNIQFIHMFGAKGSIFATAIGLTIAVVLNLIRIRSTVGFQFKPIFKRTILTGIFVVIMWIVILLVKLIMGAIFPYEETRLGLMLMLFLGVSIGGYVYLWFAYKSTLLERVFGERVRILSKIFR
ncbi:polysaccharide biosynthesis protein [Ornithinibacillus massiliensis]|uniref:Polysaccharide biosynthesis protein n=1 Tax=Ornithinibacillus massiliensis TaxID=1944633 RepID=A0ABS5MI00_9BACI|nr:polysaccharide biosynthesis protein [Ornithinibacillus massiliensis]MBS3681970.1 polysaccharide biosynthesis protein [Ornithinibacillus massiliensis]